MLHIILTILKIIGIIILAILGLIIFLLACIIFYPIKYKAEFSYEQKLTARIKVTYLFHIFSLSYDKEKDSPIIFRILGIKTNFFNDHKITKRKRKQRNTDFSPSYDKEVSDSFDPFYEDKDKAENNAVTEPSNITETKYDFPEESTDNTQVKDDIKTSRTGTSFFSSIISNIKKFFLKIKYIFNSIYGTIIKTFSNIGYIINFLKEDSTKEAFSFIKSEIKELFMHIRPKKIRGHVHFGFDDPSITGKVLGLIYIVTKGRGKKFYINPDFENQVFEGEIYIKGRIQVYKLLLIAWKIYRNENIKKIIKNRRS